MVERHRRHCDAGRGARRHLNDPRANLDLVGLRQNPRGRWKRIWPPGFRRPDGVKPKVFCLVNVVHIDRRFVAAGTQGQAEFQCHFEVPSVDVAAQHGDRRGVLKRI